VYELSNEDVRVIMRYARNVRAVHALQDGFPTINALQGGIPKQLDGFEVKCYIKCYRANLNLVRKWSITFVMLFVYSIIFYMAILIYFPCMLWVPYFHKAQITLHEISQKVLIALNTVYSFTTYNE
jgi:hypothetical protein